MVNLLMNFASILPVNIIGAESAKSVNPVMIFVLIIYFVVSALLIAAILSQTTKSEGLSGTIGGRTESIHKGKTAKSHEEKLEQITTAVAIAFLILSTVISVVGF